MWLEHLADELGKVRKAGSWDDDRVAAALGLLGDTKKTTPVVLLYLDAEVFSLDLKLTAFQYLILGILAVGMGVGGLVFVVHGQQLLKSSRRKIKLFVKRAPLDESEKAS